MTSERPVQSLAPQTLWQEEHTTFAHAKYVKNGVSWKGTCSRDSDCVTVPWCKFTAWRVLPKPKQPCHVSLVQLVIYLPPELYAKQGTESRAFVCLCLCKALLHDVLRLLERFAVESALVETSQCEKHGQRYSDSMYAMVGMVWQCNAMLCNILHAI